MTQTFSMAVPRFCGTQPPGIRPNCRSKNLAMRKQNKATTIVDQLFESGDVRPATEDTLVGLVVDPQKNNVAT